MKFRPAGYPVSQKTLPAVTARKSASQYKSKKIFFLNSWSFKKRFSHCPSRKKGFKKQRKQEKYAGIATVRSQLSIYYSY